MVVESLFGASYAVFAAMYAFSFVQLRRFLQDTPAIANERALRRYKGFVRTQQRLSLLGLCLLIAGAVASAVLVARHGLTALAVVLAVNACVYAGGKGLKPLEVRARNLPAASEPLRQEYVRVSESWVKKLLPDS